VRAEEANGLLEVQRTAGNRAATELVQRAGDDGELAVLMRDLGADGVETGTEAAPDAGPRVHRTLRQGSTGDDVKLLQMKLRDVREREHDRDIRNRARIDGIFGPLTRQDVVDFQTDTGLDPDGVAGPRTWHALDSIVPNDPSEAQEIKADDDFAAGLALRDAAQYDEAIEVFEDMMVRAQTPEKAGPATVQAGVCHQQRGRFATAVARYEEALSARFNQEELRAEILEKLSLARTNQFIARFVADPEPVPLAGDETHEGGGITKRTPVKAGDAGPDVDLWKGKLAHMMIGWQPELPPGTTFDAPTVTKTRLFQQATGLTETGEADASTWHAIDSFTKADIPFSIVGPLFDRLRAAHALRRTDPAASLAALTGGLAEAQALGLVEVVKNTEALIGNAHHRLNQFDQAVEHYTRYLARNIPEPGHYAFHLELLRKARAHEPAD
jgi:peptidoglycan hydrolase-like protein with peptidoglycan-binding domain